MCTGVMPIFRILYLLAGLMLLALGIIGIFVPLMPTTIFLILAAWCFARSSPRLERWLLNHKRLGPTVVAWRENGAISRHNKALAATGMTLGFAIFWIGARPGLWLWLLVAAIMLACAAYVLSRPEPPQPGARATPDTDRT